MKTICLLLIFMLSLVFAPQAQAFGFDMLKDAVKSVGGNSADSKGSSGNDGNQAINWRNPSQQEEILIGREIIGRLLGASPLVADESLQIYVNQVGRWIASQSERPDLPWTFGVIESEDINAFAAPGGYIVITKGLYRKLENEAQLAGVLSHEIGHVVKKHHLKLLQESTAVDMGSRILGSQTGRLGYGSQLVNKAIGNGAELYARSLDKGAEYEADRIGVALSVRAGYYPYGLPEVIQIIGQTAKDEGSVALLFKTHPHPDDRLIKLDDAIGTRLDTIKDGKTLGERFYRL
jgi:beta-barrel assembly-enhancing protease